MSRDNLVPASLGAVSERFNTPSTSITLTGVVLLLLIAFVPLESIAKLASAFQILVFVLINVAVVAFRRGTMEYEPTFKSPLYPWMQGFGAVGGLVLLMQMGPIPLVGAVLITVASVAWYLWYARDRVDREGAAVDAVRRELGKQAVERIREAVTPTGEDYDALVAVPEDRTYEGVLVDVAADLAAPQHGGVSVVRFDEVADQVPLEAAAEQSPADIEFEERADTLTTDVDVPVRVSEVVSHDTRRALAHYVNEANVNTLVMGYETGGLRDRLFSSDMNWVLTHTDCDAVFVDDDSGELGDIDTIAVVTDEGPYNPAKIAVADAIAMAHNAEVKLEYSLENETSDEQRQTIIDYHEKVADLCSVPVRTGFICTDGGPTPENGSDVIVGGIEDQWLIDDIDSPALIIRPHEQSTPGRIGRTLERWLL